MFFSLFCVWCKLYRYIFQQPSPQIKQQVIQFSARSIKILQKVFEIQKKMKLSSEQKLIEQSASEKLYKARELKVANMYHEAIQMYHRVIFLKESVDAICELAELYESICDVSTALMFYKKAYGIEKKVQVKEKVQQLTLMKGLDLLMVGNVKNILLDTEYKQFVVRYPHFHKKLVHHLENLKTSMPDFANNLLKCLAYLEVNHRKLALDALEQCLKIKNDDVEVVILKGLIWWSLLEVGKGYECFWEAYSLDRDHQEIRIFLSMILPQIQTLYKEAKYDLIEKDVQKCRIKVKKALQMHPHNTKLLILSSYLHRIKQQYEEALSNLELANKTLSKFNPANTETEDLENELRNQISLTYNEMGVYLFKQQKYTDSITLFTEGLSYKPKDWGMLSNRGDCYRSINDYVKALENYESAYQYEKKNPELNFRISSIYNMRGISLFNSKNFQYAINQFNESIKYTPTCSAFHISKAKCYIQMGVKAEAIKILEEAEQYDPNNAEIKQHLSYLKDTEDKRVKNSKKVIYLSKEKS